MNLIIYLIFSDKLKNRHGNINATIEALKAICDKINFSFAGPLNNSILAIYDTSGTDIYTVDYRCAVRLRCVYRYLVYTSVY